MSSSNSTIPAALERLSYGGPSGSIATGLHSEVIQSVGATRTLIQEESGAMCLNDVATGIVWTLPTPQVGMKFKFRTTVSRTSNAFKVITATAAQFLLGAVVAGDAAIATSGDVFTANGTTIRAITLDGDTKGGLIGDAFDVTAISATQWLIEGRTIGTGTMVDPFTTT